MSCRTARRSQTLHWIYPNRNNSTPSRRINDSIILGINCKLERMIICNEILGGEDLNISLFPVSYEWLILFVWTTESKRCETFYDLPSTRVLRSTSFGFGKKLDLANISCSPAPNKYSLHGDFEHEKDKSRGFSLGLGRNVWAYAFKSPSVFHSCLFVILL